MKKGIVFVVAFMALVASIGACTQEQPTTQSVPASPQPSAVVDQAAQEVTDAIKTPMDKARGVEDVLKNAAERTAEQTKETSP